MKNITLSNLIFKLNLNKSLVTFHISLDSRDIFESIEVFCDDVSLKKNLSDYLLNFIKKNRSTLRAPDSSGYVSVATIALLEFLNRELSPSFNSLAKANLKDDLLICRCFGVTTNEIKRVIKSGASDLLTITNQTKAAGGCGSCQKDINFILKELNANWSPDQLDFQKDFESFSATKKAKYSREKIMGQYPLDFIRDKILPLSKQYNFKVLGLVEENLYIKSDGLVRELEDFIKNNDLKLITFYS